MLPSKLPALAMAPPIWGIEGGVIGWVGGFTVSAIFLATFTMVFDHHAAAVYAVDLLGRHFVDIDVVDLRHVFSPL